MSEEQLPPELSVVMPSYNRADAIGLTLDRFSRQSLPVDRFEIIVVDDGSQDETSQILAQFQTGLRLRVLQQQNRGAAAARNAGLRQALGQVVVFTDVDVVPESDFLERHLQMHLAGNRHLVIGRVRTWPEALRSWSDRLTDPDRSMDYGEQGREVPYYYALGGNLSARREAITEIGNFDESFPAAGSEETEWAYRACLQGYRFVYLPEAVGYHNHPRTLAQRCLQQRGHHRSLALLLEKHPETQMEIHGMDAFLPLFYSPRQRGSLVKRAKFALYGFAGTRLLLFQTLSLLDRYQRLPGVVQALHWRLLLGCAQAGFREGLKMYWQPAQGAVMRERA